MFEDSEIGAVEVARLGSHSDSSLITSPLDLSKRSLIVIVIVIGQDDVRPLGEVDSSAESSMPYEVFKENNPAHVSRTTSTPLVPAQSEVGAGNRNLTTDLVSRPQGEGEKLIPNRTISMPAATSEPWWATRKVRLKSKVSTGSSPMQTLPEAEKEKMAGNGKGEWIESSGNCTMAETTCDSGQNKGVAGGLKSSDTLGEKSKGNVNSVEVAGVDQEESEGKQGGTDGEQVDRERNPGESGSKGWDTGGRPGKSRAARRAEKRKLKREEVPS